MCWPRPCRQADAVATNLGLAHDVRAGLIDPAESQLCALKAIVCHLLARQHRDVIAYRAGWTDPDRQQPVGDTDRREPRQIDTISDAELQRALDDADPLRGIAQLVAHWSAAFVLDPPASPAPRHSAPKCRRAAAIERVSDDYCQGNPMELWGRNLVSDGQKPLVSVGDVVAAVDVIATTGATNRLRVTVPTTVNAGEQQVKATTPAGAQALTPGGSDHLTLTVT